MSFIKNINQKLPNRAPTRKVSAGAFAGACSVVLVFVVDTFMMPDGMTLPAEVAAAITTIITFIVSYIIPSS